MKLRQRIFPGLILATLLPIFAWAAAGCLPAPERDFLDADLLIDVSVMPDRWDVFELTDASEDEEGQESGAAVGFYVVGSPYLVLGRERIYRYTSERRAARHYERIEGGYFNDERASLTTPWTIPDGFTFASISADQWRFGCAGSNFSPVPEMGTESTDCIYLAQYQEFLVFFTITTERDDEVMIDIDEIVHIVEAMDARMSEYLSR